MSAGFGPNPGFQVDSAVELNHVRLMANNGGILEAVCSLGKSNLSCHAESFVVRGAGSAELISNRSTDAIKQVFACKKKCSGHSEFSWVVPGHEAQGSETCDAHKIGERHEIS